MAYASLFKSKKDPSRASFLALLYLGFFISFLGLPLASLGSGYVAARCSLGPAAASGGLGLALWATAFYPSACGPSGLQTAEGLA
ncbi:hypothetical protein SGRA_3249 [Saprospira grandis str. Lewin]|uniref:Uncharacterized protein n=1 Tax=Saprospira grandis (strain Lewin) TaxID=984262 RepID=H6KZX0_SAPGL|nr:hypothetical protein SGRA_3249 [Saprospira grandis str. Lewin]